MNNVKQLVEQITKEVAAGNEVTLKRTIFTGTPETETKHYRVWMDTEWDALMFGDYDVDRDEIGEADEMFDDEEFEMVLENMKPVSKWEVIA